MKKSIIIAALLASISVGAHAEVWAVAGNDLEGHIYLHDEPGKNCPAEHPQRSVATTASGKKHETCYSMGQWNINFHNPAAGKTVVLPLTIFRNTPYGEAYVRRLP